MSKTFTIILLLASFGVSFAQQVEFFNGSRYPASPESGEKEVEYLVETQIIYPKEALNMKLSKEVFVVIKVNWEGKIDTLFTTLETGNVFGKEAERLVRLIAWQKDEIRRNKKIGQQQVKITFNPKKYKRVEKRRPVAPNNSENYFVYSKSQLDSIPTVKNYKTINDYVRGNIKYPSLALQQIISGVVKVTFIIEKNGLASNFKITKPLGGGCNEETIRLLKNIIWQPGMKNGEPVRTRSNYSLTFVHPGNTYK